MDYPFTFRQPIEKGIAFFIYTEKYVEIYNLLFKNKQSENNELNKFIIFYDTIYCKGKVSRYLKSLYKLCSILYYDKFKEDKIDKFAEYLNYYIGAYRIEQSSIVERTSIRILRDKPQNLLDVISQAFLPKQIFDFIIKNTNNSIYENEEIPMNSSGVRSTYKKAILNYYEKKQEKSLKLLKTWIEND